ncbi:MAG: molybdopterin-dependent oxidoreductase [Gammaproteobacteria bacterium]|nr:molybdopterin-dependent oxidoreductase [Gammaproteobacteria bacterium]
MAIMKEVKTTCPYCGVGCGVIAALSEEGHVTVKGDPEHPSNYGRLCSKGAALADTIGYDGRLLYPEVKAETENWDNALNLVADKLSSAIRKHGSDSVAFYVSGQLLTEDYYVANKLMKGFIGSGNIDTNSRLCMSSAVAGYKRAFGTDTVPGCYEDLERAKLVVLTGSNTAWCHPVLFQRIKQAKENNPDLMVVVIDPRQTASCDIADMHLPLKPGTDQMLFNGLLRYLNEQGETNSAYVKASTQGLEPLLESVQMCDLDTVAWECGLEQQTLESFYRLFARTERVVTLFSQGINQWSNGSDRVNAIINCHLLTGRIGRSGMGPFSITGQPNAMGGREVGGLANQLAAHMAIENKAHRDLLQTFWQSPSVAATQGLKAVDLFKAVHQGKIKVLWIMATNPAVSLPDSDFVRQALERCECVVVSDCMRETDTTKYADILLPAQTWGERDGTVTSSERRISRQRAFLPTPGEAKPDWWIIAEVAKRMGHAACFQYQEARDIFIEHAALSGFKNNASRAFDISLYKDLSYAQYDALQPLQWPVTTASPGGTARMFSEGEFFTESKKACFISVDSFANKKPVYDEYPLLLNTGRVRDQWHTMTRTGKSSTLSAHVIEPYAEVHPEDAKQYGLVDKALVSVSSVKATIVVRVVVSDTQQKGSVFIPIHWNDRFSSKAYVDSLVSAKCDPLSGQPEYKKTDIKLQAYKANWYGFLISRRRHDIKDARYWASSKGAGFWHYELAGDASDENWAACARRLLCSDAQQVNWIEYFDKGERRYRAARIENDRLESCLFIGPDLSLPGRDWLAQLFKSDTLSETERHSLLTGKPADAKEEAGKVVCACFGVGIKTIKNAIIENKMTSVEEIGVALKAGTNCGSCVPELKKIIRDCSGLLNEE